MDARADLYSLGATLYELFAGRPPFVDLDRAGLVHAHIALRPDSPRRFAPDLPPTLARIVLKLLEKDPDARYQAAATLARDLRRCLGAALSGRTVDDFPLGEGDVDDRFRLSQVVVGRAGVLEVLREAAGALSKPAPRAVWVTGAPGIGKSALVRELEREVAALDGVEYRDFLARHLVEDAVPDAGYPRGLTLDSPWVTWVYDALFSYRGGDRDQPDLEAPLALRAGARMVLGCRGATYWRMQGGMGDVVFSPLYEALVKRGVEFRFFHRVERLRLDAQGGLAGVEIAQQARVLDGAYQPFVDVGGLPCWPEAPLWDQLEGGAALAASGVDLEGVEAGAVVDRLRLERGRDFDVVVSGLPLGVLPQVAADLVAALPRWRALVDGVPTVATKAAQVWLDRTDDQLGVPGPPRAILHRHDGHYTIATDMSQTLSHERWPADAPARTVVYLCDPLRDDAPVDTVEDVARDLASLYPAGARQGVVEGDRIRDVYLRRNTLGGERFTHPAAGTTALRPRADESGVEGLVLAGDYVRNGLDVICIEGAVSAGLQAARAVIGTPDEAHILRPLGGLG